MKNLTIKLLFLSAIVSGVITILHPRITRSAPPSGVRDVLSSSQLSYFARLGTGVTYLDTHLNVDLSGDNPSNSTYNLFVGDTVGIGQTEAGAGLTLYTIRDIGNTAEFQINTGLGSSQANAGSAVIATHSAIHTVYFTPKSNITGGAWQFLVKATSRDGESHNDGIPDQEGFDIGATTPSSGATGLGTRLTASDISCPFGATASVGTTAVIDSNSYHVVTCDLGAGVTNPVDVGATITIGRALASGSQIINPAPAVGHTVGQATGNADTYKFYIRHLDDSDAIVDADTAIGRIAVVESVRVTATIDPTISFYIDNTNVGAGATRCGVAVSSGGDDTTATSVLFGSLTLSQFNNLAQRLRCNTNATSGYSVTVYEVDQMKNISSGTTIPDTDCDGDACNATTTAAWDSVDANKSEFGYSMESVNVGTTIFNYQTGWRAFGEGSANAQEIMSNSSTPTAEEAAYICYRITAVNTQEAGNYEGQLVFTATATF